MDLPFLFLTFAVLSLLIKMQQIFVVACCFTVFNVSEFFSGLFRVCLCLCVSVQQTHNMSSVNAKY